MSKISAEFDYTMDGLTCVILTGRGVEKLGEREVGEAVTDALARNHHASFQDRAAEWLEACFGESADPKRKVRRAHRFCEESVELVQSLGIDKGDVLQLVDYVYGRPVGDPKQEVGGVMLTLAGACVANGLSIAECQDAELARVWTKVDAIRAKNGRQEAGSPLPGSSDPDIDKRTGRPFGDHGTASKAIDYALDMADILDAREFLYDWRTGDLEDWPGFYPWLAKVEAT